MPARPGSACVPAGPPRRRGCPARGTLSWARGLLLLPRTGGTKNGCIGTKKVWGAVAKMSDTAEGRESPTGPETEQEEERAQASGRALHRALLHACLTGSCSEVQEGANNGEGEGAAGRDVDPESAAKAPGPMNLELGSQEGRMLAVVVGAGNLHSSISLFPGALFC